MDIIEQANIYQKQAESFLSTLPAYPKKRYDGQGIVICAGGEEYFTCAWVCIKSIRRSGCTLPIEVWYLDRFEFTEEMENLLASFDITCINASEILEQYPVVNLINWELKAFAILHSKFREVLYLDADNFVLQNPAFLFESKPYQQTGSIFWPDRYQGKGKGIPWLKREAWAVCRVPFRDETEFETGQLLINKEKCWYPLNLCMHYNSHSDFYYYYFYGDKDSFHLAWRKLGYEYTMIPHPNRSFANDALIIQYNPEGIPLFQHRNGDKWSIHHKNQHINEFEQEDEALRDLAELKNTWSGFERKVPDDYNEYEQKIFEQLITNGPYNCVMEGSHPRSIQFLPDHSIEEMHGNTKKWSINRNGKDKVVLRLKINSRYGVSCQLWPQDDGTWSGWWNTQKREKITIASLSRPGLY